MKTTTLPRKVSFEETGEAIKQNFLTRARNGLFDTPYPGYPEQRYVADNPAQTSVPEGPWTVNNSHAQPLTAAEKQDLIQKGIEFNEYDMPVHPWLSDMIADPRIGVVGGPGTYWHHGPNYTADPIAISRLFKKVLLIRRGDTGAWALPGGFLNGNNEDPLIAAPREMSEESRLGRFIRVLSKRVLLYVGIVADKRTTASSWAHTHAVLLRPLIPWPHVKGSDDAAQAKWFKRKNLPEHLFGSHKILVDLAFDYINGNVIIE